MLNFRGVFEFIGLLLSSLSVVMLVPMLTSMAMGESDWRCFAVSAFFTAFIGLSLVFANQGQREGVNARQLFLSLTLAWLIIPAFAALPFVFSHHHFSYTDAYFEAMSGISASGSSIVPKLSQISNGILLWRALLHWLGGISFIIVAITLLPMMKIGGMQHFRMEASDKMEKILPRATHFTKVAVKAYILITVVSAFLLWLVGMPRFEAICHAMAAIAGGGFSTKDNAISAYNSVAIEGVMALTMLCSALPFILYIPLAQGNYRTFLRDSQVRCFMAICTISVAICVLWFYLKQKWSFGYSIRVAAFNVISSVTTSGFSLGNISPKESFPFILFLLLALIGGCTCSASGGLKIFRVQLLWQVIKTQIKQFIHPHGIFRPQFNGKPVAESIIASVMVFSVTYIAILWLLSLVLALSGMDFTASFRAVLSAMTSSGFGMNKALSGSGVAFMSDWAKWVLSLAMMIGRVEIFTLLVCMVPGFWRD